MNDEHCQIHNSKLATGKWILTIACASILMMLTGYIIYDGVSQSNSETAKILAGMLVLVIKDVIASYFQERSATNGDNK